MKHGNNFKHIRRICFIDFKNRYFVNFCITRFKNYKYQQMKVA